MFRIPNTAKSEILAEGLTVAWKLHLFVNDVTAGLTPGQVNDLETSDFTEAAFPGYSSATLSAAGWTFTPGDPGLATRGAETFTLSSNTSATNVYGYYFTRSNGGQIRGFRQWTAPRIFEFSGDELTISPAIFLSDKQGDLMHTGSSVDFRGTTAPDGWLLEDGSAVSRTVYPDLFAVIGETYGSGDGSTTFNLPDSRGRFRLGKAASGTGSVVGETGGELDHTHDLDGDGAHARIFQSGSGTRHQRIGGLTPWAINVEYPASGGFTPTTSSSNGTRLGGASDTSNPAYLAATSIIKH